MKQLDYKMLIRNLLGGFFIFSALMKLLSIQDFEVYVYSFGVFSLGVASFFSRLLIGLEIALGALLILGVYMRKVVMFSMLLLIFFSVFIGYLLFSGNVAHCHCFGDYFVLSHKLTFVKNIVLIGLFILIYSLDDQKIRYKKVQVVLSLLISFSIPFIYSFPPVLSPSISSNKITYNERAFSNFLAENPSYSQGNQVLCFYSTGCKYCRLATQKMSVISKKSKHPDKIKVLFMGVNADAAPFFKQTNSVAFHYKCISVDTFLQITDGKMPLILLVENGEIIEKYRLTTLDEKRMLNFLSD